MWSVREGLEKFIQSLELTPDQQKTVIEQHTRVRECLRQRLGTTDFLSGSYSRNTAIRPLHDVDVFVVLGKTLATPKGPVAPSGLEEDKALRQVREALHAEWPNKELPTLQQHSVHIAFSGSDNAFDVVPAFEIPGEDAYLIHERYSEKWIRTNPRRHEKLSTEANERAGKKLKPLIKAVKHWNRHHRSSPLRSFHLETMSYGAFASPPRDYLEGLEQLFTYLSQRVLSPCPDPAGLGPPVDERMDPNQRKAAHDALAGAANQVRLARQDSDSNPPAGHARLQQLFGSFYHKG